MELVPKQNKVLSLIFNLFMETIHRDAKPYLDEVQDVSRGLTRWLEMSVAGGAKVFSSF